MLAKLKFFCPFPKHKDGLLEMMRWLPEDVSTYGHEIDSLFFLIYYITAATFILVTVLMVLFLVMYREGLAGAQPIVTATRRSRSFGRLFQPLY